MKDKLLTLGFLITDHDEANTQFTRGLIDVFLQSDGNAILAYNSVEILPIKDIQHLALLVDALTY